MAGGDAAGGTVGGGEVATASLAVGRKKAALLGLLREGRQESVAHESVSIIENESLLWAAPRYRVFPIPIMAM